jgi:hypothetical protein
MRSARGVVTRIDLVRAGGEARRGYRTSATYTPSLPFSVTA